MALIYCRHVFRQGSRNVCCQATIVSWRDTSSRPRGSGDLRPVRQTIAGASRKERTGEDQARRDNCPIQQGFATSKEPAKAKATHAKGGAAARGETFGQDDGESQDIRCAGPFNNSMPKSFLLLASSIAPLSLSSPALARLGCSIQRKRRASTSRFYRQRRLSPSRPPL